jgi:LacI family transcriptional regulator
MSTIKDVARLASVGVATASRALSGKGSVSADTAERVRQAATRLDYRPSAIARALSLQRSGGIGLYTPDFSSSFYAAILTSVDVALRGVGRHMIATNGCGPGDARQQALEGIDFLLGRDCDGLVVVSHHLRNADFSALHKRHPHTVIVNRQVPRLGGACFAFDHVEGGRLAARALLSRGHRQIALVSGPHDAPDNEERVRGFVAELALHGLSPVVQLDGQFTHASGAVAATQLLALLARRTPRAQRCSAVFCANDLMALALVSRVSQAGWRVPEDLSVIGYDDADVAAYASPPLTTVRVPIAEASAAACRHLLNLCYELGQPVARGFECAVAWRQSVGDGPHAPLGPAPRALSAEQTHAGYLTEYRSPATARAQP